VKNGGVIEPVSKLTLVSLGTKPSAGCMSWFWNHLIVIVQLWANSVKGGFLKLLVGALDRRSFT
jgi:hypothetical protein